MIKQLVNGVWHTQPPAHAVATAAPASAFRQRVTADGSSGFKAEPGRYHLYVSWACPFAHRTLIVRALKGLQAAVPISVLDPYWGRSQGWTFAECDGCTPDKVNGSRYLHELYTAADPNYTGKATVPLLWDTRENTAVNNESADIMRMLNCEFDACANVTIDLYPPRLRTAIDEMNRFVGRHVNAGVYRAGFAATQARYEQAVDALFAALDELEARLARQPYLLGERITEADWRLFPTLVRFDLAYYGALNCNLRRLHDFPNLWRYTRALYQIPGIAATVRPDHIKRHYYDHYTGIINRTIVPKGPLVDFAAPVA